MLETDNQKLQIKLETIIVLLLFIVACVVAPYAMEQINNSREELDKREIWMNQVQLLLEESTAKRFGVEEMDQWQRDFAKKNNLSGVDIPTRRYESTPVLPKNQ